MLQLYFNKFKVLCAPDQGRQLMPKTAPRGSSCFNVVDDGVYEKDMEWIDGEDIVNKQSQELINCH